MCHLVNLLCLKSDSINKMYRVHHKDNPQNFSIHVELLHGSHQEVILIALCVV